MLLENRQTMQKMACTSLRIKIFNNVHAKAPICARKAHKSTIHLKPLKLAKKRQYLDFKRSKIQVNRQTRQKKFTRAYYIHICFYPCASYYFRTHTKKFVHRFPKIEFFFHFRRKIFNKPKWRSKILRFEVLNFARTYLFNQ